MVGDKGRGKVPRAKGLMVLCLVWLLSWSSHLLATGSVWEGSGPQALPSVLFCSC